jgi:CDP-glucose 4,6-dehydratase
LGNGRGALEDLVLNPSFWRGRKVLVTGHSGFKGSWLCLWLQQMGAEVTGFAAGSPSTPCLFEVARVDDGMESLEGDIRDTELVRETIVGRRPEIVIHLAAQPLVRRSYVDPVGTYATNVLGTVNVLDAVRQAEGPRVVINVTTDKVYANREWEWGYREDEPKGGRDPYSNSKACSELVTSAYRDSFFGLEGRVAVATVRAGNVIGGGDWGEDRLIPDIMRAALGEADLHVRNPGAIRPWQHVLNPLSGYLVLAQALCDRDSVDEGWNFGPSHADARPVRWIADRFSELWPGPLSWELDRDLHPPEASFLTLSSDQARRRLGWRPVWDLDQALQRVVEWHVAHREGADMRTFSVDQLDMFGSPLPA